MRRHPVVGLIGARQVGKTTLARMLRLTHAGPAIFDLESPQDVARLADPELALGGETGLVILDEIQLRPDLFPVLRVLADRSGNGARFLVTGSASPGHRHYAFDNKPLRLPADVNLRPSIEALQQHNRNFLAA